MIITIRVSRLSTTTSVTTHKLLVITMSARMFVHHVGVFVDYHQSIVSYTSSLFCWLHTLSPLLTTDPSFVDECPPFLLCWLHFLPPLLTALPLSIIDYPYFFCCWMPSLSHMFTTFHPLLTSFLSLLTTLPVSSPSMTTPLPPFCWQPFLSSLLTILPISLAEYPPPSYVDYLSFLLCWLPSPSYLPCWLPPFLFCWLPSLSPLLTTSLSPVLTTLPALLTTTQSHLLTTLPSFFCWLSLYLLVGLPFPHPSLTTFSPSFVVYFHSPSFANYPVFPLCSFFMTTFSPSFVDYIPSLFSVCPLSLFC